VRDVTSHGTRRRNVLIALAVSLLLQPVVLPFSVSLFISFVLSLVPISLCISLSTGPLKDLKMWQYIYI
jgi:hypothetical protein